MLLSLTIRWGNQSITIISRNNTMKPNVERHRCLHIFSPKVCTSASRSSIRPQDGRLDVAGFPRQPPPRLPRTLHSYAFDKQLDEIHTSIRRISPTSPVAIRCEDEVLEAMLHLHVILGKRIRHALKPADWIKVTDQFSSHSTQPCSREMVETLMLNPFL